MNNKLLLEAIKRRYEGKLNEIACDDFISISFTIEKMPDGFCRAGYGVFFNVCYHTSIMPLPDELAIALLRTHNEIRTYITLDSFILGFRMFREYNNGAVKFIRRNYSQLGLHHRNQNKAVSRRTVFNVLDC